MTSNLNGPIATMQNQFNHVPKFVNERSQYISPYHSDSAVDSSSRMSKKKSHHHNHHNTPMITNQVNGSAPFNSQHLFNTMIPELMPPGVPQTPQMQAQMQQQMQTGDPMQQQQFGMQQSQQMSMLPPTQNMMQQMPGNQQMPQMQGMSGNQNNMQASMGSNQIPNQQGVPPHMQQQYFNPNNSFLQPNNPPMMNAYVPPKKSKKHKYRPSNCQSDSEILEKSTTRSLGGGSVGRRSLKHFKGTQGNNGDGAGGANSDNNWDKDTVITDATSNKSSSVENIPLRIQAAEHEYLDDYMGNQTPGCCDLCMKPAVQIIFVLFSLLTPVVFAILPKILWIDEECSLSCLGSVLNLAFRLAILFLALWAIFFRKSRATLPSINLWKTFLFVIVAIVISIAWVFYAIKILKAQVRDYDHILNFSLSICDCLIFIHYLAVVVLEIKHLKKEYIIKVVRNTDGESKFYSVGHMSLQHCAAWVVEKYYKDFPVYNPYLMSIPGAGKKGTSVPQFKLYNIDGNGGDAASVMENSKAMIAASARNRDSGRNTRFYEEQDFDRRLRKRRARLIEAVEDAFMHIKRPEPSDKDEQPVPMDAEEAAEAIFPSMARALQKYLKISRQTHCYSLVAIKDHLARCITLDFTPRAFLEKYLTPGPVITSEVEQKPFQNWELITDTLVNRGIHEGLVFQLRQDALSLVIYVAKLPRFHIREESMDQNQGRFVLRLQSETSV